MFVGFLLEKSDEVVVWRGFKKNGNDRVGDSFFSRFFLCLVKKLRGS